VKASLQLRPAVDKHDREKLIDKGIGDNKKFRWRSHEISRIEA